MENKATVIMVICCLILGAILWQVALIKPDQYTTRYQIVDFTPEIRMVLDAETGVFWQIGIKIIGDSTYIKRREIGEW